MRNLVLVIAICFSISQYAFGQSEINADNQAKKARELYNQYCAGCHGAQLDRFAGRQWIFGSSPKEMASTIKNGRPSIGMPAFGKAVNDEEIKLLADFILTELPHMISKPDNSAEVLTSVFTAKDFSFELKEVVSGLDIPWGTAFLPNGDMLVTDKPGVLYRIGKTGKVKIDGVPRVMLQGQGGLLDVALHPNFKQNSFIYLAFAEKADGDKGNTSIIRAVLKDDQLSNILKIFHATPNSTSGVHFGSRIVFDKRGYLYFSVGERGTKTNAQDLSNASGKIHRLFDDGRIPPDNPFVGVKDAVESIWSYGHRNPQSLFYDKANDLLWENEHGPKGGDELNIIRKGKNYGWPLITFGIDYDGTIISPDTAKVGLEQPAFYWIPSIGPSGMTLVTSDKYKGWKGNLLCGSLSFKYLERLEMKNNKVISREKLLQNIGRVRNIVQGPDGYLYISVEGPGRVYKIVPK